MFSFSKKRSFTGSLPSLYRIFFGVFLLWITLNALSYFFGLPNSVMILRGVKVLWTNGTLQHDIQVSTARWFIGWSIGSIIGINLGILTGRFRYANLGLEGFLVLLRAIPFVALVPLVLRLFGLDEGGKFFLVGWASAGICWVIIHQHVGNLPQELFWRAKSLGVTRSRWFFHVLLPASRSGVFSALRTSLSIALIVVAVAEMSGVYERSSGLWWSEGLGYRIFRAYDVARDDFMLGALLIFAFMGVVLEQLFVMTWHSIGALLLFLRQRDIASETGLAEARLAEAKSDEDDLVRPSTFEVEAAELEIDNLTAGYLGNEIITQLEVKIPAGGTLSVVGPSGCGKTTLLRAIGHFRDEIFEINGDVSVASEIITDAGPWVGVVFQDAPVYEFMTVWDNVLIGSNVVGEKGAERAWTLLNEFGLASKVTVRADNLSGGERQRLAIASALANQPKVLLLDEPFGSLDAITRRQLQIFFRQHVRGKVTSVFVTHDLDEALIVGTRVAVGVARRPPVFQIDQRGRDLEEWEFEPEFVHLKRDVFEALRGYSQFVAPSSG